METERKITWDEALTKDKIAITEAQYKLFSMIREHKNGIKSSEICKSGGYYFLKNIQSLMLRKLITMEIKKDPLTKRICKVYKLLEKSDEEITQLKTKHFVYYTKNIKFYEFINLLNYQDNIMNYRAYTVKKKDRYYKTIKNIELVENIVGSDTLLNMWSESLYKLLKNIQDKKGNKYLKENLLIRENIRRKVKKNDKKEFFYEIYMSYELLTLIKSEFYDSNVNLVKLLFLIFKDVEDNKDSVNELYNKFKGILNE